MTDDLEFDSGDIVATREGLNWHYLRPLVPSLLGFSLAWLVLMTPSVTGYVISGFTLFVIVGFVIFVKSKKVTLHGYKNAFVIREGKVEKIIRFHKIESAELMTDGLWNGAVVLKGQGQSEMLDFENKGQAILDVLKKGNPDLTTKSIAGKWHQKTIGSFLIAFVGGIAGVLLFVYSKQMAGEWFMPILTIFNVLFILRTKKLQSTNRLAEVLP